MKTISRWAAVAVILLGICPSGRAVQVINNDAVGLDVMGRVQLFAPAEFVDKDPVRPDTRAYLFLKETRLGFNGHFDDVKFNTEMAFGGEAPATGTNGSNGTLGLLDFNFDLPLTTSKALWLKAGQFKVPFGRENLDYEGEMIFATPSLNNLAFILNRDAGVALYGSQGHLAGTVGVFTGAGFDIPQRYIPEKLGIPMMVLRVGYRDGMDEDLYHLSQNDLQPQRVEKSLFFNVAGSYDSLVGHSDALSLNNNKNIFTDSNFNPYIVNKGKPGTPSGLDQGGFLLLGWDAAGRGPLAGGKAWSSEAEMDYGSFANKYGDVKAGAARIQGSVIQLPFEVALRGAALFPDSSFVNNGTPIFGSNPIYEVTPAITYYIKGHGHHMKVILDAPILINTPVIDDITAGSGSYVLADQSGTDLDTVAGYAGTKGNVVRREVVPEARLMLQMQF